MAPPPPTQCSKLKSQKHIKNQQETVTYKKERSGIHKGYHAIGWAWLGLTCLDISIKRRNRPVCTSLTSKEKNDLYTSMKCRNRPVCTSLCSAATGLPVHLWLQKNRPVCTPLWSAGIDLSVNFYEAQEQTCLYTSSKLRNRPVCTSLWSLGTDMSVHLFEAQEQTCL